MLNRDPLSDIGGRQPQESPDRQTSNHSDSPPLPHKIGVLLGEVISQTDLLLSHEPDQQSPQPQALQEVARKYYGQQLSLDPILLALVDAVVSDLFSRISRGELRQQVVRHVAETLHDDPAAFQRISAMWQTLQRRVQ